MKRYYVNERTLAGQEGLYGHRRAQGELAVHVHLRQVHVLTEDG